MLHTFASQQIEKKVFQVNLSYNKFQKAFSTVLNFLELFQNKLNTN